jgi:hypothetical protein
MGPVEFLKTAFDGRSEAYICIWVKGQQKKTYWIQDENEVEAIIENHREDDIYVGMGLVKTPKGSNVRAKKEDVIGIPGLWVDIDVANPEVEDKKDRAATVEDALKCIDGLPEPTFVIKSGFGVHCWWLFETVWLFDGAQEREAAEALTHAWNQTIQGKAKELGFDVDSTYDLARVLRLPGSINWKGDAPREVEVLKVGEYRYESDYLSGFLSHKVEKKKASTIVDAVKSEVESTFVLDPEANPPFEKFDALLTNIDKFEKSWNRQRRDLPSASASEYDYSLAAIAARSGWSDQEIVNLIIASRRRHGDDLKLRFDYFNRTLMKIRSQIEVDNDFDDDVVPNIKARLAKREPKDDEDDDEGSDSSEDQVESDEDEKNRREKSLEHLSTILDLPIDEIQKYTSQPPKYRMVVAGHGFMVGDVESLITQSRFRNKIAGEIGVYLRRRKEDEWSKIAQLILNSCVDIEVTQDQQERGMAEAWLISFLSERVIFPTPDEAAIQNQPFWHNARVHIYADSMRNWLWTNRYINVDRREFSALLRAYGCSPVRISLTMGGRRTTRSCLRVPDYITDIFRDDAEARGII